MRSLLLATAALGLSGALAAAHADLISIGLSQDGGAISTVASGAGNAFFSGTFGAFAVNNISGTGTPPNPEPNLLTNSINVTTASAGHTLNVFITEQGLSSPIGINAFLSTFTSNAFIGKVASVGETTLLDIGNGLYGGTLLDSQTFTTIGIATSLDATPNLAAPYSETAEFVVTSAGSGSVNDTINITKAPEPATFAILGVGLVGLGFIRRRCG